MMLLLVFAILISYFVLNLILSNNNLKNTNLGGSFILTDQNGNTFNSKKIKLKNLFILDIHIVLIFALLIL